MASASSPNPTAAARILALKFRTLGENFLSRTAITGRAAAIEEHQLIRGAGLLVIDAVQRGFLGGIPHLRELVGWAVNDGPDPLDNGPHFVRCPENVFVCVKGGHIINARNVSGKDIKAGTPVLLGKDVEVVADPEGGLLAKVYPNVFPATPYLRISLNANPEESQTFHALLDKADRERSHLTCLALAEIIESEGHLEVHQVDSHNIEQKPDKPEVRALLIERLEQQKSLMIAVATGGPRIKEKETEYRERRIEIMQLLAELNLKDPNPFIDLWSWYGRWSDGSLPTYRSRRQYIGELYQPLLDELVLAHTSSRAAPEPTGWARVDRGLDQIRQSLERAGTEEQFQVVGLLSREVLISLAQAVFDSTVHKTLDGVEPSKTDAARMLESYIAFTLSGATNEQLRKNAKAAMTLALGLQHKRTASFREAAFCAEATQSLVNLIAIVAGRRDP